MKKFRKAVLTIGIIVIILMCLVNKLGTLGFSVSAVSEDKLQEYSAYYYNQLSETEKRIYVKVDEAINKKQRYVFLGAMMRQRPVNQ